MEPDVETARLYLEEGRQEAARGHHEEAIDLYDGAIEANPEFPVAYYERAYSRVQLRLDPDVRTPGRGLVDLALRDYSLAIRYNPAYADAYYNRAMLHSSRARYKQAARDLMNAVRFNTADPEAHLVLGRLYEEKFEGRRIDALQHYEKYVDLGGDDPKIRENVALWKQLNQKSEAPAPTGKTPTPKDEEEAARLHQTFATRMKENDRNEALRALQELLTKYGHTRYVARQERYFKAILRAFEK